jgi:hypothetical protein
MKLLIPAYLTRYGSKADNTFSLSFNTNELKDSEVIALNKLKNQYGFLMFKSSEIENSELEQLDSVDMDLTDKSKTPSKRLRSVLYLMWEQNKEEGTFKDYYSNCMERIIEHYKNKLD